MDSKDWRYLPDHIIVELFLYLPLADRNRAARVCRSWYEAFKIPVLWSKLFCYFMDSCPSGYIEAATKFGMHVRTLHIELDQKPIENRESACAVLERIAAQKNRRLKSLTMKFTGENPLFYYGQEIINALTHLFDLPPLEEEDVSKSPKSSDLCLLSKVDLSGVGISINDDLVDKLSACHCRALEYLDIQSKVLVCRVTPACIQQMVQRCKKLRMLKLFNFSLSEEVLTALMEDGRAPLEHLSILCCGQERYAKDISSDVWRSVCEKLPGLRVSLTFNSNYRIDKVLLVMKPEMPVITLFLEPYANVYDELALAGHYYKNTLEKLTVMTPPSPELNATLIELAQSCTRLTELNVYCVLYKETVDKILELLPIMKERKTYRLKCTADVTPCLVGRACLMFMEPR